jgi:hypothetical protein
MCKSVIDDTLHFKSMVQLSRSMESWDSLRDSFFVRVCNAHTDMRRASQFSFHARLLAITVSSVEYARGHDQVD